MSGFDYTPSTTNPAAQHPDSVVTEPVPVLWEEIHLMPRRISAARTAYLRKWLKQSLQSWKSVFRRPGQMIPNGHNRLQTR